ncbi:META domain-containing protein [Vreelandella nanhaiensis]|uniref:META domain-containing protein n=2 Tax=Vreelandella nanhaiensis TaxID=1258546 RepID=A0A433KXW0_9GAMM|nr:META domain-containing protein [Halomonas nanhaiensis]RUR34585.1 META domain-containing protein [Halomonas nanhaiensis]
MFMKRLRPRTGLLPVLALATLLLNACSSAPGPQLNDASQSTGLSGPVVGQRWNLLLVGTDERLSFAETPFFTISKDGKMTGSDGCNRFTGQVNLGESQRIDVKELATTRMACPQMADAKRVTDMLDTAYRYLIDHDRLVFFGPDSRVLGGWRKAH